MPICKICKEDVKHRKLKHLNEVHKLGLKPRGYKIEEYFEVEKPKPSTESGEAFDKEQAAEETGHKPVRPKGKPKLKVMREVASNICDTCKTVNPLKADFCKQCGIALP